MDKHGKHGKHAKWKKSDVKCHILYDSIYIKYSKKVNLWRQKLESWLPRDRNQREWRVMENGHKRYSLGDVNVLSLDCGNGCRTLKFTENCWVVYLQWVNFICKSYLNKAVKIFLKSYNLFPDWPLAPSTVSATYYVLNTCLWISGWISEWSDNQRAQGSGQDGWVDKCCACLLPWLH